MLILADILHFQAVGGVGLDEGLAAYGAPDVIVENNISEGNGVIQATGSRDEVLGNISIGEARCFRVGHKSNQGDPADDVIFKNNVCFKGTARGPMHESPGGTIDSINPLISENNTVIGTGGAGVNLNNSTDKNYLCGGVCPCGTVDGNKGDFCGAQRPDAEIRNSLTINNNTGIIVNHASEFGKLVLEFINSYGNSTNWGEGTGGRTSSMSIDPKLGSCIVYIPPGSPMKGAGKNGADIGANIIYRYENGILQDGTGGKPMKKLWNQTTGQFPCGVIVPGVNDIAGS